MFVFFYRIQPLGKLNMYRGFLVFACGVQVGYIYKGKMYQRLKNKFVVLDAGDMESQIMNEAPKKIDTIVGF